MSLFDLDELTAGLQELLPGVGPASGTRWRNVNTGQICTVLGCQQRRRTWVQVRANNTLSEIDLATFEQHWQPFTFSLS